MGHVNKSSAVLTSGTRRCL